MAISTTPNLENSFSPTTLEQEKPSPYCTLTWRRGMLLVKPKGQFNQPYLPATDNKEALVECLKHSPVNLVLIDPELGFSKVKFWADATTRAGKSIYLSIPSIEASKQNAFEWLQVILNSIIAFVLLVVLSPVALYLAVLTHVKSPDSLFTREWHVGKRGKLFQVLKFRTTVSKHLTNDFSYQNNLSDDVDTNYTLIEALMRKYGWDNALQLLNVLRGEMNLFGRRSCKLEDAIKMNSKELQHLNKAPGVVSSLLVAPSKCESELLHLDSQTL